MSKYGKNCPILEKAGHHISNQAGGENICLACIETECVLDSGRLIKTEKRKTSKALLGMRNNGMVATP
jgi:hypothetical protein